MIEVKNLNFAYGKQTELFNALNLQLTVGNVYGLLGKNGAGKTTLLKILTGLLFPQGGDVNVLNFKPRLRDPNFLQEIYLIPEEFFLPSVSVREYEKAYAPFYPRFDHRIFEQLLKEFEIPSLNRLSSLSFGQKKKFLIAFGLATQCKILFLDEPTNGLDIPTKSQFRKILASSVSDERTILISTHQVRDMANLIDPIIILDEGQIIFNQNLEDTARRLVMKVYEDEQETNSCLFCEKTIGGYIALEENKTGEDSKIDIELLFNAVINNRERIMHLFEKEV
ncbi:MAG: ABC transporter ATP-binding protein [Candidatus Marinimicrobia bacterium]|nr:ABC transporter ATP-binding protein [Candidatus Neomarinimicrobiota bacterium]